MHSELHLGPIQHLYLCHIGNLSSKLMNPTVEGNPDFSIQTPTPTTSGEVSLTARQFVTISQPPSPLPAFQETKSSGRSSSVAVALQPFHPIWHFPRIRRLDSQYTPTRPETSGLRPRELRGISHCLQLCWSQMGQTIMVCYASIFGICQRHAGLWGSALRRTWCIVPSKRGTTLAVQASVNGSLFLSVDYHIFN